MTPAEIAAARALCDAATPGPWDSDGDAQWCDEDGYYGEEWVDAPGRARIYIHHSRTSGEDRAHARDDAAFIAAARTLLPRALDALEAERARVRELEAELRKRHDQMCEIELVPGENVACNCGVSRIVGDAAPYPEPTP